MKETSNKAIEDQKLKVAGQPKINLKTFGEGKDLDYTIEIETMPDVKLKPLDKIKAIEYDILVENSLIEKKIKRNSKKSTKFF